MQNLSLVNLGAASRESNPSSTAEAVGHRWEIWRIQQSQGQEPCFRTEQRHGCNIIDSCPWHHECQAMIAEWQIYGMSWSWIGSRLGNRLCPAAHGSAKSCLGMASPK